MSISRITRERKLRISCERSLIHFLQNKNKLTAERIDQLNQNNTNLKITLYAIIILVSSITIAIAFSCLIRL